MKGVKLWMFHEKNLKPGFPGAVIGNARDRPQRRSPLSGCARRRHERLHQEQGKENSALWMERTPQTSTYGAQILVQYVMVGPPGLEPGTGRL